MFKYHDHLGFNSPFYTISEQRIVVEQQFADAIEHLQVPRQIDVSGVIQVLSRYHCFADRTMLEGIYRTPWMAKPSADQTNWEYATLPSHGDVVMSAQEAATTLFAKLQAEILAYCEGRSTVGVLLSGGMDSRMVAGVLDYLIKTRQTSVRVVAITWGMEHTRDVVYAKQIAHQLGWEWVYYPISATTLFDNITETAKRGCEYSPVHLHAMPNVREIKGVDCILAASYGDSVGRAEYGGKSIIHLEPFENYVLNWFKLLRSDVYNQFTTSMTKDINQYRVIFPRNLEFQQREVDSQAHYMRRKLNHCMGVIDEKVPLFQLFTSPEVFGFMWSLSPQVRNDAVYKELLGLFQTDLTNTPWARTGKRYLSNDEPLDTFPSLHHRYGEWIRGELYESITSKVLSGNLERLEIFNMQAVESAIVMNRRLTRQARATKLDEISIWLAALADFVQLYSVQGHSSAQTLLDNINGLLVAPLQVAGLSATKFLLSRK